MKKPFIIAEVGNNAEGNIDIALELVESAKNCGADAVKFQCGSPEGFARTPDQIELYKRISFDKFDCYRLIDRGIDLGIPVFFSVWSIDYEMFREGDYIKIPARQCNKYNIEVYDSEKTFISIPHTENNPEKLGISRGIPLHCVTEYPAQNPMLWRIPLLRTILKRDIGYSDHTIGIEACIRAYKKYGAIVLEKHFTFDHDWSDFRDHKLAATPKELKKLIREVRK